MKPATARAMATTATMLATMAATVPVERPLDCVEAPALLSEVLLLFDAGAVGPLVGALEMVFAIHSRQH